MFIYKEGINHVQVRRRNAPCLYIKKGLTMFKYGEGMNYVQVWSSMDEPGLGTEKGLNNVQIR